MPNRKTSLLLLGIGGLTLLCFYVLGPFLIALSLGAIFGTALTGVHERLMRTLRMRATAAAFFVCLVFTLAIMASLGVVGVKAAGYLRDGQASEVAHLREQVSGALIFVSEKLHLPVSSASVVAFGRDVMSSLQILVTDTGKNFLSSLPDALLQFTILVLTLFLFLANFRKMAAFAFSYHGIPRRRLSRIKEVITDVCRDVVFANVTTGVVQAGLVALGAAFFSSVDPALIFVLTFVTSFIPVIGAAPVAGVLAGIEILQRNYGQGISLVALMLVVGVADNIVRAWLMSQKEKDSAFFNLLACVGGIYAWGLPGIFLGPMVMSTTLRLVPILLKELGKEKMRFKRRSRLHKVPITLKQRGITRAAGLPHTEIREERIR